MYPIKAFVIFLLLTLSAISYCQQAPEIEVFGTGYKKLGERREVNTTPPSSISASIDSIRADGSYRKVDFTFAPDSSSCTQATLDNCWPTGIAPGRWNKYDSLIFASYRPGVCKVTFICGGQNFVIEITKTADPQSYEERLKERSKNKPSASRP